MSQTYYTIVPSPVDDLLLVSDGEALTGLYMEETCGAKTVEPAGKKDPGPFREVKRQLSAYFAGELRQFDLPIRLAGTEFQKIVWAALRDLQFGQRVSYGELARRIGRPSASRAVGLANGRNPVGIIVPCHRVIGASGSLVGYGGGLHRKQWLLEHEHDDKHEHKHDRTKGTRPRSQRTLI
ncbi:MAG TPA: methylated-DNA--[protein]-cysteine S-methyltransferase [Pirellulales bacterium]|nr:methylated-DNA--[protein]-cysteine S-methyltransferase [Pirellulales bacterium]